LQFAVCSNFRLPLVFPIVVANHAARLAHKKLGAVVSDPALLAEVLLEAWRFYGYDLILVFADTMVEAEALGCKVALPEDDDAYLLAPPESLPRQSADPLRDGRMPVVLGATAEVKAKVKNPLPLPLVLTSLKGPFSLASFLLGVEEFLLSLRTEPSRAHMALELALANQIRYADAIIEAGGIPFIGDPVASGDIISRRDFETFALPYLQQLIRHIRQGPGTGDGRRADSAGLRSPVSGLPSVGLHICGDTTAHLPLLAQTEADILSLDEVDLKNARRVLGSNIVLMGNVPTQLIASGAPDEVRRAAEQCLADAGPNMILASACDIPANAPVDNVRAIVEAKCKVQNGISNFEVCNLQFAVCNAPGLARLHALLDQLVAERKSELARFKTQGGLVVGYLCNYTPRELITACGAIPVRLAEGGSYESRNQGEKYIRADACPFCKSCLGLFENDPLYELISVLVVGSLCDQMRRLGEIIHRHFGIPVLQMSVPRTRGSTNDEVRSTKVRTSDFALRTSTRTLYRHEVNWLRIELEHLTGKTVSGEVLGRAMLEEDEKRSLLRALNETRKSAHPMVTETDILRLVSSTNLLSAQDCSALLRHNLIRLGVANSTRKETTDEHALEPRMNTGEHGSGFSGIRVNPCLPVASDPVFTRGSNRPRLLLAGSIVADHDRELVAMIEERATIVADLLCNGVRTFLDPFDVPVTDDTDTLMSALADYYFDQPGCIQRRSNTGYYDLARRLIRDYQVEGILYKTLLFCDAYNYESVRFRKEFDLPFLHLDTDYGERNREQIRTRVEAFLETI
jgi:uroporphyrinogen decarboxylase